MDEEKEPVPAVEEAMSEEEKNNIDHFLVNEVHYFIFKNNHSHYVWWHCVDNLHDYCNIEYQGENSASGFNDNKLIFVAYKGNDAKSNMFNDICPSNYTIFKETELYSNNWTIDDLCQEALLGEIAKKEAEFEDKRSDLETNEAELDELKRELDELNNRSR